MKIREEFLPLAVPDISNLEISEVIDTLKSGWISVGPKVKKFEEQFALIHGVKHAIATSSCTTALFLALKVLGIKKGDYIIVPTITWQSTANIVEQLGAKPIFCDVNMQSMNISIDSIQIAIRKFKSNIKAIIPVHMSGLPVEIDAIEKIAADNDIKVVYDAAHSVFSSYRNKMIGGYGIMSTFSFYATKNITTGDGGIITTNDDKLAESLRIWSYHGLPKDSWKRYSEEAASPHVQCIVPGYKFNLTDLQAALGLAQLERRNDFIQKRNKLISHYNSSLSDFDYIETPIFETKFGKWGNHVYVIKLLDDDINRDAMMQELRKLNIGSNLHFYPVHKNIYYSNKYSGVELPSSEWLMDHILTLPLCTKYSTRDLDYVIEAIQYIYNKRLAHC